MMDLLALQQDTNWGLNELLTEYHLSGLLSII